MGKYHRKNKTKINIPIRVAAVLLCLTLISTYFVSGLFARYATSGQSSGNARVAKFSINGGGVFSMSVDAVLAPGDTQEVPLIIENNSEVSVEYTVTVTNKTNNLPLEFSMKKEGASSPFVTSNEGTTTFTAQHIPGSHTDKYWLSITWNKQENDIDRMGMVDHIAVTVTAVQID